MEVQFKRGTLAYKPILLQLQHEFYAIDQYKFNVEKADAVLSKFLLNPDLGVMYAIEVGPKIIGYVAITFSYSFEFGGRIAFLDELFISEAYRNKGLGSKTLEFVLALAPTWGIKVIHLEAERHNLAGKALYYKFGFQDHDRHLMTKKLD